MTIGHLERTVNVMMPRAAVLGAAAAGAFLLGGCGSDTTARHTTARVPRIVGLKLRAAEEQLFMEHLRWRIAPGSQVFSRLLPDNVHVSTDDLPVTGQKPAAGTATRIGAIVTIITPCTSTHPCA